MKINKKTKKFVLILIISCFFVISIFMALLATYQYSFGLFNMKADNNNIHNQNNINISGKNCENTEKHNETKLDNIMNKQPVNDYENTEKPQSKNKEVLSLNEDKNHLLNKNYIGNYSPSMEIGNNDIVLVGTMKNGLFLSKNGGQNFGEVNKDIFRKTKIIRIEQISEDELIIVTKNSGVFITNLDFNNLATRNKGLHHKVLVEDGETINEAYRDITNFAGNPNSPNEFFLSTKYNVYYTDNLKEGWKTYTSKLRNINCIDFNKKDDDFTFLLGTSIKGLYRQKSFKGKLSRFDKNLTRNGSIVEELSSIYIDADDNAYTGFNYKNRLFKINLADNADKWSVVMLPFKDESHKNLDNINDIRSISARYINNERYLTIVTNLGVYETNDEQNWRRLNLSGIFNKLPTNKNITTLCIVSDEGKNIIQLHDLHITPYGREHSIKTKYYDKAKNSRGMYLLTHLTKNDAVMEQVSSYLKNTPMNSVVIDMKDDYGRVRYKSELDIVRQVGSSGAVIDIDKVISEFKKQNVYIIARIVLFKDERLYGFKGGRYAVRDGQTNKPWAGHKYERWVDPYSEFVQDYNISIAKELISLGVDEIQFDYARFPTDGKGVNQVKFSYQKKGMTKKDALESFFRKARKHIDAPLSIDIYGRNGWYQINDRIGQDPEMLAEYVDVICPMFYPSHFGSGFLNYKPYKQRPLRIYYYGALRAKSLVDNNAIIRPYVQAFKISSNTYDKNYYNEEYIINEIKGCDLADEEGGYTFWNAGNKYYIVQKAYDMMNSETND